MFTDILCVIPLGLWTVCFWVGLVPSRTPTRHPVITELIGLLATNVAKFAVTSFAGYMVLNVCTWSADVYRVGYM